MELEAVKPLCLRIEYEFRDPEILKVALTHTSYSNEHPRSSPEHNERLEFLGDAVLDFVISDMLISRFPLLPEGALSKMRASLVSEGALSSIARDLDLGGYLRMGRGERMSGGHDKDSILSDAFEALLAAVYLDSARSSGTKEVGKLVERLFSAKLEQAGVDPGNGDFKTELQELIQSLHKDTVQYQILDEEGPDHEKQFKIAVMFQGQELGWGIGRSKKQAEQEAARQALGDLRTNPPGR